MDIALAFDEAFVEPAQVVIESILDSHKHRGDLTFWLATTADVAKDRAPSLELQLQGRARLRLLAMDDGFRSLPVADTGIYRSAMYLRLFLPSLVSPGLARLLYLDSDVLVHADLDELWTLPLSSALLAAVVGELCPTMGGWGGVPGMGPDIDPDAPYFNSGVMLINLPAWRSHRVTELCLAYLHDQRDHLRFPDQDALNLATYGRWLRLAPEWNDTTRWWQGRGDDIGAEAARVTHFIGPRKPWHDDFPLTEYRQRYLELAVRVPSPAAATG